MRQPPFSLSKNLFFGRLKEVTKVVKTSNTHSSAYVDTVEGVLRSKSKCLAQQVFYKLPQSKIKRFLTAPS